MPGVRAPKPERGEPVHIALILAVRKLHGWTQAQLGYELGVGASTIANWENGRHDPAVIYIQRLRDLANVLRATYLGSDPT